MLVDLEHVGQCWLQLGMSVTQKSHVILSHLPFLLHKFNGGFDKLEESRIESSHQFRTRDHHRLARMGDKNQAEKFEAKLQNIRVNKEISTIQNEVNAFNKRKLAVRSMSLKKEREKENRNQRIIKRQQTKQEIEGTGTRNKAPSARSRKLSMIVFL